MPLSPRTFSAIDIVTINSDIKYLFRTTSLEATLKISLISDAPLLFSLYKTKDVTRDGNHLPSHNDNDTFNITAMSKVFKQPSFGAHSLWKEILLTKEILHGTLQFKLRNQADYVMDVKTYDTTITGNILTNFEWIEGTD